MTINVIVSFILHGEIQKCSCECVAGRSTAAHCKHAIVTLFGTEDHAQKRPIRLHEACTQELQTWHQPAKRHFGSTVKAKHLAKKKIF